MGDSVTIPIWGLYIDDRQPHYWLVAHCSETLAIAGVANYEIATQIVVRWPDAHAALAGTSHLLCATFRAEHRPSSR